MHFSKNLAEKSRNRRYNRAIPDHRIDDSFDKDTIEAYERYVLAQFRFKDTESIEKERKAAIESLIPGSINFCHLYFLDLAKRQPD
jgi:hypothetical protein